VSDIPELPEKELSEKEPSKLLPFWRPVATLCGIGHLRPGPGSWASAVTALLWYAFAYRLPSALRMPDALCFAMSIFVAGIPAATAVSRAAKIKDPQFVVIDEVVGQLIALIAVPLSWKTFLASFILFRAFDIVKPPPVRQLEKLPEGSGIMLDDVAAGIYAWAVMQLLLHFGLLS
jgi:phosphatidylglycerophosphatase A